MKKIKDERLILKNLKNIRIAFTFQTIGIISILVYKAITIDLDSVLGSPLWFVLMISCLVTVYLNINIAIDNEEQDKKTNQVPYYKKILIILVIGIVTSLLIIFTSDTTIMSAVIIGAVFFLCFTATYTYTHHLKKKRLEDDDEL